MPEFIEITNFSDPALDVYARLTENQLVNRADPVNALFIAESPLVIGRALDAGCVPVSSSWSESTPSARARRFWSAARTFRFSSPSWRF